jgi:hypothetical protein
MNANIAGSILVPLLSAGALVLATLLLYSSCGAALI